MGNIFKKLFRKWFGKEKQRKVLDKKELDSKQYEAIGRLIAVEIQRDRNFRRQVGRTALGSRILKIAQK